MHDNSVKVLRQKKMELRGTGFVGPHKLVDGGFTISEGGGI